MIKTTVPNKLLKTSVLLAFSAVLGLSGKANTADTVTATNLSAGTSYSSTPNLPTSSSDVEFPLGTATGTYTLTGGTNLSIGTLDDLATSGTITINSASGANTITLNGGSNSVAPSPSDLLYSAGGSLTITGGSGSNTLGLVLGSSGNFDIAGGTTTISSIISGTGDIHKTGTGNLALSGANTFTGNFYVDNTGGTSGDVALSASSGALGTGTLYLGDDSSANNAVVAVTSGAVSLANSNIVVGTGAGTRKLQVGTNESLAYTSGNISLDSGATLQLEVGASSGSSTLVLGNTLASDSSSGTGAITGTGNITIGGTGANRVGTTIFDDIVNNAGTISNAGVASSAVSDTTVTFNNTIGSNVTSITESSADETTLSPVMTLSGVNSFTGTINIAANSTVAVVGAGSLGNNGTISGSTFTAGLTNNDTGTIADSGTFTYGSSATQTLSGALSGAGLFSDTGTGPLTLTGANTFTGNTTVGTSTTTGSLLEFGNLQSLYFTTTAPTATNLIVYSGNTLALGVGGTGGFASSDVSNFLTAADAISSATGGFESGSNIGFDTTNAGGSFTYSTAITNAYSGGTLGLVKLGTGTLLLNTAESYTGTTTISAGTLQLGDGSTNGTLTTASAITDNGTLIFDEATAVAQGTDFGIAAITGTGAVTVEGPGAVTFNQANTFTSLTDSGSVNFTTVAASGMAQSLGEGLVTLAGTSSTTGVMTYTGGTGTLGNNITVTTGDQGSIVNNGNSVLTLSGAISKDGSVLNLIGGTSNPGEFNITGQITGASTGSDLNVINTVVTLSNTNTYNGPTTVSGDAGGQGTDTLQTAVDNALPSTSVVTLGSTSLETDPAGYENSLDLDGTTQTIAGLSSQNDSVDTNQVVNSSLAPATLNITTAASTSYTFGGTVGGAGDNVAVVVNGAGTQKFTGANTYTGGTTVSGGTLQAGNATALGTGDVTVNGGTLQGTVANVTLGGNLTVTSGVLQENTTGTGTFTLTGSTSAFALSGGTWDLDINGGSNDLITSTGGVNTSFTISGGMLDLAGDTLTVGDTYTILSGFGTGSGQFGSITGYDTSMYNVTFNDTSTPGVGFLDVSAASAAPEPSTWAMLLGGVALLVGIQRRRRSVRI